MQVDFRRLQQFKNSHVNVNYATRRNQELSSAKILPLIPEFETVLRTYKDKDKL